MTTSHCATPEQWARLERGAMQKAEWNAALVVLELRDRLAAAEQRIRELEYNYAAKSNNSALTIEPSGLSDEDADDLFHDHAPWETESEADCARRIYRSGWDAAMAASEAENDRRFQACVKAIDEATPDHFPDAGNMVSSGSLVGRVADAIIDASAAYGTANEPARAAIRAIAGWLLQQKRGRIWVMDIETITDLLEMEANK